MIRLLTRPVLVALTAAGIIMLGYLLLAALRDGKRAETVARVESGRADAAVASGKDAVNTIGSQQAAEAQNDALTRSNEKEIRDAEGANAPVAKPAVDAGLQALCRRRVYADDPRCIRLRGVAAGDQQQVGLLQPAPR